LAIPRIFSIARQPTTDSKIFGSMMSKNWVVHVLTSAFCGCICPINISRVRTSPWMTKMDFTGFVLRCRCEYGFNSVNGVQSFSFKNNTSCSAKKKLIFLGWIIAGVCFH
jgi:hypothetical protein